MIKKLIINADDFGVSEDINSGIIKCYTDGIVTDISLMAVGESFDYAVKLLKDNNINNIGVHLTLTGGFKSISKSKSITNTDELFPQSFFALFLKILLGISKKEDIYNEFKAQIQKIKETGIEISHIDSHQHIHMFPAILKIVIKIMKEENIGFIRFPVEKPPSRLCMKEPVNFIRNLMLRSICFISKNRIKKSGLKHNDYFGGSFHAHNLTEYDINILIDDLKDGLTEFCCHPGFYREISKTRTCYKNCEKELNILCSNNIKEKLKNNIIQLISHKY